MPPAAGPGRRSKGAEQERQEPLPQQLGESIPLHAAGPPFARIFLNSFTFLASGFNPKNRKLDLHSSRLDASYNISQDHGLNPLDAIWDTEKLREAMTKDSEWKIGMHWVLKATFYSDSTVDRTMGFAGSKARDPGNKLKRVVHFLFWRPKGFKSRCEWKCLRAIAIKTGRTCHSNVGWGGASSIRGYK